jgi:hypothetical protein
VATSVHCRNNPQQTMISLSTDISGPLDFAKSLILKVEATSGIEPEYTVLQTVA